MLNAHAILWVVVRCRVHTWMMNAYGCRLCEWAHERSECGRHGKCTYCWIHTWILSVRAIFEYMRRYWLRVRMSNLLVLGELPKIDSYDYSTPENCARTKYPCPYSNHSYALNNCARIWNQYMHTSSSCLFNISDICTNWTLARAFLISLHVFYIHPHIEQLWTVKFLSI